MHHQEDGPERKGVCCLCSFFCCRKVFPGMWAEPGPSPLNTFTHCSGSIQVKHPDWQIRPSQVCLILELPLQEKKCFCCFLLMPVEWFVCSFVSPVHHPVIMAPFRCVSSWCCLQVIFETVGLLCSCNSVESRGCRCGCMLVTWAFLLHATPGQLIGWKF